MIKRYLSLIITIITVFICCMVISCDCRSTNPPNNSDSRNSLINSVINNSGFDSFMADDEFPDIEFDELSN